MMLSNSYMKKIALCVYNIKLTKLKFVQILFSANNPILSVNGRLAPKKTKFTILIG